MPCRSGWPSAVRGSAGVCAPTGATERKRIPAATILRMSTLPLACCFGRSRASQNVDQGVVSFVAGVLVDRPAGFRQPQQAGPRSAERLGIVDGEVVADRVGRRACETLDDTQTVAGSPESRLVGEIRRLDDQRAPIPAA